MPDIIFKFEQKNLPDIQIKNASQDDSILDIALENNIHLHHNCGGVCACSTCHIYIENGEDFIEEISDKEEDFIDRARSPKLNSRLACQCVILNSNNGNIEITIPDQTQIQGE